ncbi:hypothetical protein EPO44_14690, partial [bacterium]
MKRFQRHPRLLFVSLVLFFLALFRGAVSAQDSAIETLKRQLADMQQQMQKMVERIEQLEREKAAEQAQSSQAEPLPSRSAP